MTEQADTDYLTTEELATMLRTKPETLRYWRYIGSGPKGFKAGRRWLYERGDVLSWIEARKVTVEAPADE